MADADPPQFTRSPGEQDAPVHAVIRAGQQARIAGREVISHHRDGGLDAGTVLSGLDDAELARLRERVAHVREVCTGYPPWQPGPCPAR